MTPTKISEVLTDENRWTQGASWRDETGRPPISSVRFIPGYRYCIFGAAMAIGLDRQLLSWWYDKYSQRLSLWNDAPERTFAEVRVLVLQFEAEDGR